MSAYDRVMEERRKLVEKIIENMKQGYVMPQAKWDRSVYISNPVSHARYRGINFARLYLAMADQGYTDGRWMTYKQAESMGWKIRRGEHGIHLEKYIFEKTVEEKNPNTGEMEKITKRLDRPMVNQFVVFNASQIDGIPQLEDIKPMEHDEVLQIAEDVIASSECPIKETMEGRAYYSPGLDEIHLPVRDLFIDQKSFLATTLHEMVHSTGHSSRLNRDLSGFFGGESYAREELRAELGAFFLENDLGIQLEGQHFNSHTQYLESWISALENDPNELFRAMTDAQKAAGYITDRYQLYLNQKLSKTEVVRDEQLFTGGSMEDLLSEPYPWDMREQEAAAIRASVKLEHQRPGHGAEHMEDWLQIQCQKENAYMDTKRAGLLMRSYHLVKTITDTGMVESFHQISSDFPRARNTIEAVFGYNGTEFRYNSGLQMNTGAACVMHRSI